MSSMTNSSHVRGGASRATSAGVIRIDGPTRVDRRIRRATEGRVGRAAGVALSPLFPVGLPGGYILIAYAIAHTLGRRHRRGGATIINSAWLGWFAHRGAKMLLERERPYRKGRHRLDSFPSGHTTGVTSLAVTIAYVLRREGLVSGREAAAIAAGIPLVMGSYRVVAGDHWATDVLAGWLLGGTVAAVCCLTSEERRRGLRRRSRQERVKYAAQRDRSDFLDDRAHTARPFVR